MSGQRLNQKKKINWQIHESRQVQHYENKRFEQNSSECIKHLCFTKVHPFSLKLPEMSSIFSIISGSFFSAMIRFPLNLSIYTKGSQTRFSLFSKIIAAFSALWKLTENNKWNGVPLTLLEGREALQQRQELT